jgi:uncharacterized protein (DUF58 family)
MSEAHKLLTPTALSRLAGLEMKARLVVEGFISGLHKSPFYGFNVEFAEHRPYQVGDDIRYIDWKLWAKTDRFFIKQFEEETNLKSYLVLDTSASMGYEQGGVSKLDYGTHLCACLTYLMLKQKDSVGLSTVDKITSRYVPPRSSPSHLQILLETLASLEPLGTTDLFSPLHLLASRISRRGLIIVISDLIDDADKVVTALKHLRRHKHEVIVFHLFDQAELAFPFKGTWRFRDPETMEDITIRGDQIRKMYLNKLQDHVKSISDGCRASGIDYYKISTSDSFESILFTYLRARSKSRANLALESPNSSIG